MTCWIRLCAGLAVTVGSSATASEKSELHSSIQAILAASSEGKGNAEAAKAWLSVAAGDASTIPTLLAALDQAGPMAANWLLTAIDAIAERTAKEKGALPASELKSFVAQTKHVARARRIAFELYSLSEPAAAAKLVPEFLQDPSPELRRDAVAYWVGQGEAASKEGKAAEAKVLFEKALGGAVDEDQVDLLAKRLGDMGTKVDKAAHYGLILDWKVIGPFDNTQEKGYYVAYPPEMKVDFTATYEGKNGQVAWKDFTTTDPMGQVDLNKAVVNAQGVTAYAASTITLDAPRKLQIRFGTPNGWKLWVNGKYIFGREEYHSGENFDQYIHDVELARGSNVILFKCCQNEQTEDWAKDWRFQLRVCDGTGAGVRSTTRPPSSLTNETARAGG